VTPHSETMVREAHRYFLSESILSCTFLPSLPPRIQYVFAGVTSVRVGVLACAVATTEPFLLRYVAGSSGAVTIDRPKDVDWVVS
jgi:hypothetical protein